MMTECLKSNLKRYGQSVYLTDTNWSSEVYSALVEPLRYKNKMYMIGNFTEIGHYGESYYLYIGPPEKILGNLSSNALLHTADNRKYNIFRTEVVKYSGKSLYVWAIIREKL